MRYKVFQYGSIAKPYSEIPTGWAISEYKTFWEACRFKKGREYIFRAVYPRHYLLLDEELVNHYNFYRDVSEHSIEYENQPLLKDYLNQQVTIKNTIQDEEPRRNTEQRKQKQQNTNGKRPAKLCIPEETPTITRGERREGKIIQDKTSLLKPGARYTGKRASD